MKTKLLLSSTLALALLTGCGTTGLSPHEVARVTYPNYILSLPTSNATSPRAPFKKPARLAVAQIGESAPPRELLRKLEAGTNYVVSVVSLPAPGEPDRVRHPARNPAGLAEPDFSNRIQSLCLLAKTMDADYLFICGGDINWWHDPNALHILDVTLVGAAIFPSNKIRVEGRAAGALLDTTTGQPVLMLSTDYRGSGYAAAFFTDEKTETQCAAARKQLAANLGEELLKKIANQ